MEEAERRLLAQKSVRARAAARQSRQEARAEIAKRADLVQAAYDEAHKIVASGWYADWMVTMRNRGADADDLHVRLVVPVFRALLKEELDVEDFL